MNIHHNARLTPLGRERMVRAIVEGGQTPQAAARAAGVCPRTARKWVDRFKAEGLAGLADRSSRPQRLRQPTSPAVVDQVIALRRRRLPGQHIAKAAGVSHASGTESKWQGGGFWTGRPLAFVRRERHSVLHGRGNKDKTHDRLAGRRHPVD